MSFTFELEARDPRTAARAARWTTPHGFVETPCFMPVGTQATVKGLTPDQLKAVGVQKLLVNTYHLALRPGRPRTPFFLTFGQSLAIEDREVKSPTGEAAPRPQ